MGHSILRRLPWGLVAMIGLMIGVERFIARGAMRFQDTNDWSWRSVERSASRDARRYDLLCFGDSQIKLGVVPRAIRERTGFATYNLANSGAPATASYFVLRRALNSGAKPAAVIVDFSPFLLRKEPRSDLGCWSALLNPAEAALLAYWANEPYLAARVTMGWLFPSFRCKDSVRANLLAALRGAPNSQLYCNFLFFRNWTKNDGAHLLQVDPTFQALKDDQIRLMSRKLFPYWKCGTANAVAIDRFLALAAAHHIPVYWVLPPLIPPMHSAMAKCGFDAEHENFIRSQLARHANLTVIDGRGKMNDLRGFCDSIHLSAEGAYGFSLALGDVLRKSVPRGGGTPPTDPASRWLTLAECRPVDLPDGLENIHQSELAMNAQYAARR